MAFAPQKVTEPFPIYLVASRYFIYDPDVIAHVRQEHRICGVLVGTLPQLPQQNVFLGAPLQLMTEEATLLLESGAAYIIDDKAAHQEALSSVTQQDIERFHESRKLEALAQQEQYQRNTLEKLKCRIPEAAIKNFVSLTKPDLRLFNTPLKTSLCTYSPLRSSHVPSPNPSAYALYKHVHSKGYFVSPGLRFGSQFMAYPDDPLRYHSHFLATGFDWDQNIDMVDIVGGGRLGTGVKKAWMVGALDPDTNEERIFCITWAGFG